MGQTLSIGGLVMDPDSCWFKIHKRGIIGNTGRLNYTRVTWDIHGRVSGTTKATVDAKVVALESAIAPAIDIVFSLGSTMKLISSATTRGTMIQDFSWNPGYDGVRGSGAEGVLRRTFHLVVSGDFLQSSDTDITAYHESIQSIGTGGPRTVPVGSLTGDIQPQQTQARTVFYAIQSGYATGLTTEPSPPLPKFTGVPGVFYIPESLAVTQMTPATWGLNRNTQFGIRWSYKCWSSLGLVGSPGGF